MQSILVPLIDPQTDRWTAEKAVDTAANLGSHLTALLIDPVSFRFLIYPHYEAMAHHPALIAELNEEAAKRRRTLEAILKDASERRGLAFGDDSKAPSVTLTEVEGDVWTAIKEAAPVHDAILFARQSDGSGEPLPTTDVLKDALEYAGRPVLVLTDEPPASLTSSIGIAWNGSAEGARAVSAALPMLARADQVVIFTFTTDKTDLAEAPRLCAYLKRHGIDAEVTSGIATDGLGETLLKAANERAITLLVTGGYTHSRLRQAILGGVTRHLLTRCRIPMLMAH